MNEATPNKVCPKCRGTGKFITTGSTECPMCKGVGFIDVSHDQFQCGRHNYPPDHVWQTTAPANGFPKGYGYDNKKTLLDEFAMAAMAAIVSKRPHGECGYYEEDEINSPYNMAAGGAYSYAPAMMAERNRRDEMENVKEATEQ